jgi:hypothetical protein
LVRIHPTAGSERWRGTSGHGGRLGCLDRTGRRRIGQPGRRFRAAASHGRGLIQFLGRRFLNRWFLNRRSVPHCGGHSGCRTNFSSPGRHAHFVKPISDHRADFRSHSGFRPERASRQWSGKRRRAISAAASGHGSSQCRSGWPRRPAGGGILGIRGPTAGRS